MNSIQELLDAVTEGKSLFDVAIEYEMKTTANSYEKIYEHMRQNLKVMIESVDKGVEGVVSHSKLTGMDAKKMDAYIKSNKGISGDLILKSVRNAIATNEVNASMGLICATPTAGSAGVVPGVLMSLTEQYDLNEDEQIKFLFVCAIFGLIIANNASISGAVGGCQAEIGSASAMASAATVYIMGGSATMSAHAMAITIKNMLGLICDPVAGLVEVPCIKRNALGATQAIVSADIALAGIESRVSPDDVISAMDEVGRNMSSNYKETARGGLAITKSGLEMLAKVENNQK